MDANGPGRIIRFWPTSARTAAKIYWELTVDYMKEVSGLYSAPFYNCRHWSFNKAAYFASKYNLTEGVVPIRINTPRGEYLPSHQGVMMKFSEMSFMP